MVYLCRFLQAMHAHNVLYNVATTLLSFFCYSRFALRFFAVKTLRYYIYSRHPTAICTRTRNFPLFRIVPTNCAQGAVAARLEECRASFLCLFPIGLLQLCLVFCQKCGFFKLPQFLYTYLLTLVLLTNNNFRVSSLYMFFRYATGL